MPKHSLCDWDEHAHAYRTDTGDSTTSRHRSHRPWPGLVCVALPILPGALILAAVAPLATLWALTSIGEVSASTLERKLVWANIQYVAITLLPVGLLALSIDYSGRRLWLSPKHILPLCLVPMVTLVLLWTDLHHLMRSTVWLDTTGAYATVGRTFGPWFWFHSAYSYALIAAALGITLATTMSTPYFYRRQPLALLVGIIIPSTGTPPSFLPLGHARVRFHSRGDIGGGLFAAWGILQIRVFNLVPVARHTLVEDMADGVLVLDETDRVVDLNRSAQKLIGRPRTSILSRRIGECWDAWTRWRRRTPPKPTKPTSPSQTTVAVGTMR